MKRLAILITLALVACAQKPPVLTGPPTAGGLLPPSHVRGFISAFAPVTAAELEEAEEGEKLHLTLTGAETWSRGGRVQRVVCQELDCGEAKLSVDDSSSQVRRVLGEPSSQSPERWVYRFGAYRYDFKLSDGKVEEIQIVKEPGRMGGRSPVYGKGTYGDSLPDDLALTVDGVRLHARRSELENVMGQADPRVSGGLLAFGPELETLVFLKGTGVERVQGRVLEENGQLLVQVGESERLAQEKLGEYARLKSHSAGLVTYTFLDQGLVTLMIVDKKVAGVELKVPRAKDS